MKIQTITSRDNLSVKAVKRLAQRVSVYKDEGLVWLEGEHLCDAFLTSQSRLLLQNAVLSQSIAPHWLPRLNGVALQATVLPDGLFAQLSSLPSSGGLGFVLQLPQIDYAIHPTVHTVILDQVQDAGNVGSILRSAAAFGVSQVLAMRGTAAFWSPKVLRAAMGAHFSLHLVEDLSCSDLRLDIPILATHVREGEFLHELQAAKAIPHPCAWIMGSEGQGTSQALLDKASCKVRIRQLSEESLNVAAAAAVCLHASMPILH